MSELKRKLSSRKLWAAVAGVVTGLAMVFGLDEGVVTCVAGAVVSVASVITYIITEGKVDAESVKTAVESVQSAVEAVGGEGIDTSSAPVCALGHLPLEGKAMGTGDTSSGPAGHVPFTNARKGQPQKAEGPLLKKKAVAEGAAADE